MAKAHFYPLVKEKLPPTDSRLRPDQRHLENGEYEKANAEKLRLETRQRMVVPILHCYTSFHEATSWSLIDPIYILFEYCLHLEILHARGGLNSIIGCLMLFCPIWCLVCVRLQARKMQESGWKPRWFQRDSEDGTYRYVGGYWEAREQRTWVGCNDIFGNLSSSQKLPPSALYTSSII